MFARVFSGGLMGIDAYCIEVEVDCTGGIGQIQIVGLPDASVKESQERVRSAIKACSFLMPHAKKWVINLAPADTRKEGPAYDLPIAVGILAATGLVPTKHISAFWFYGELSLDGSIRPTLGVLPVAIACKEYGCSGIIVPDANAEEAALVDGLNVYPVSHLKQVCSILERPKSALVFHAATRQRFFDNQSRYSAVLDFKDVKGQAAAKRALEIAAAGHHNILLVGPPGSGKSMLAQRLPGVMPMLSFDEAIEVTKLYSVAGLLTDKKSLVTERPFRTPHHSASASGLVGGGRLPKPGEISLSHKGILFLDELTEFPRVCLDNLRQPLETNTVTISRAAQTLTYPAAFLMVGACNPCPCGYRGDPIKSCTCTPSQADRYWSRLSGPFLDRVDLQIEVARLKEEDLVTNGGSESSEDIRLRVMRAVERQRSRYEEGVFSYNGQMSQRHFRRFCEIDDATRNVLARAITQMGLSARTYDRVIRIARTIADLADRDNIQKSDVLEALRYRLITRPTW